MNFIISNESLNNVFRIAKNIAIENYNTTFSAPHLLIALMNEDVGLKEFVRSLDKDPNYIYDWADVRLEEYPKSNSISSEVESEDKVDVILEEANIVRIALGLDEITPVCVLASIVRPNVAFTLQELKSLPLRDHEIINYFQGNKTDEVDVLHQNSVSSKSNKSFPNIEKYCDDVIENLKKKELVNFVGRDNELKLLLEIFCRRTKSNVIITGEPGVGKSTLIEGLALEIIHENVPIILKSAKLLELNTSLLFSNISYKSEVEDRLKKIIQECKQLEKAILFIDEIHLLLDPKSAYGNIANLLKPELAKGRITIIGATTQEEYRKIIEPERAFNRRFEIINVPEPDNKTCEKMLLSVIDGYKEHHEIDIDPNSLSECVRLAKRYSKGKKLPDSALDLLDHTMAAIKMLNELSERELLDWEINFQELVKNEELDLIDLKQELIWQFRILENRLSPILWGSLRNQPKLEDSLSKEEIVNLINETLEELKELITIKRDKITGVELAAVMATKTKIPIGKIQAKEKDKLLNMEDLLRKRVVGQDHALKTLAESIIENRSGLNKPGQPIGSFFFLGPTGTGKTELAKSIAELLFNDEKAMIRFDMSEFKEEHSAALLYGSPPGYVGYEEGGMLVNKIREQPYSVVLFDEIEKAHSSVFDVFLQIMDEGKVHDKLGKEGDFSNALILFTSNVGSEEIINDFDKGIIPSRSKLMKIMNDTRRFRPEFLARITEVVPFSPINEEMAINIFNIQLKTLEESLKRLNIGIKLSEEAIKYLALNGFNNKYGARQIGGVIRTELSRPISRKIVKEEVVSGDKIYIDFDAEKAELIWKIDTK